MLTGNGQLGLDIYLCIILTFFVIYLTIVMFVILHRAEDVKLAQATIFERKKLIKRVLINSFAWPIILSIQIFIWFVDKIIDEEA